MSSPHRSSYGFRFTLRYPLPPSLTAVVPTDGGSAFLAEVVRTRSRHEGPAESHDGTLGVGIRGLGVLDDGEEVRVHVDLWEQRDAQDNVVRVRWRPLSEEPHGVVNPLISAQQEQCPGEEGWHSTGWIQIDGVDIRQK